MKKRLTSRERFEAAFTRAYGRIPFLLPRQGRGYVEDVVDDAWFWWQLAQRDAKRRKRT